jgi:acyl-coenzyme A thioesterase PaaI-like protein
MDALIIKKALLKKLINFWPPYAGAGIRVRRMDPDMRAVDVELRLHKWNQNYVGTHFGGSLYAMCDPFFMLMLMENLGRDYIVWDKSAQIRYRKPGKGTVRAEFRLTPDEIDTIRARVERDGKTEPVFKVEVRDVSGEVVVAVEKTVHVRKK